MTTAMLEKPELMEQSTYATDGGVSVHHGGPDILPAARRFRAKRKDKWVEYLQVQLDNPRHRADYWAYGYQLELQEWVKGEKPIFWACKSCLDRQVPKISIQSVSSSTHIRNHLLNDHNIATGKLVAKPTGKQTSVVDMQRAAPAKHERSDVADKDNKAMRENRFRLALVRLISCVHLGFAIVEQWSFQRFCATLSDDVIEIFPFSHVTVATWVMVRFEESRAKVKRMVHKSRSRVHISFDIWTSKNGYAMLAVVGHYIDKEATSQSALLGLRVIEGAHTGENIAEVVVQVLSDYEIDSARLGCFVLDNATNNDTCVESIARDFGWPRAEAKRRRLRCMGHIINLVAQAFLFGSESEVFDVTIKAYEDDIDQGKVDLSQLRGPVGKLHHIVLHIRKTPQRRNAFKRGDEHCNPTKLVPKRDNDTRWNSAYEMIKQAMKLRNHIDLYCINSSQERVGEEGLAVVQILTQEDWLILAQICACLEVFKDAAMKLQGAARDTQFGFIWEATPWFEMLSLTLKEFQDVHPLSTTFASTVIDELGVNPEEPIWRPGDDPATEFITEACNFAHEKLKKYYDLTGDSVWWLVGLVMNPTLKWKYLEYSWKNEEYWLAVAKKQVQALWKKDYKPSATSSAPASMGCATVLTTRVAVPSKRKRQQDSAFFGHMYGWKDDDRQSSLMRDEYEIYCNESPLEVTPSETDVDDATHLRRLRGQILQYWIDNEKRFPNLSRLAFDALSIPAMSAECERTFSSAKITIGEHRCSLEPPQIEAVECLRQWWNRQLVSRFQALLTKSCTY
jgi:hypothetical protein